MNAGPDAEIVEQRGYYRGAYDPDVRDVRHLRHQEGRGAHDRRHQLAAGRSGGFYGAGEFRRVAETLHHRDSERARAYNVGYRTARYRAHEAAGEHRNLSGATRCAPGYRIGQVYEVLSEASLLEVCAKQDEQEDECARHAQRDAEDALCGEVQVLHKIAYVDAPVRELSWQVGAHEGIQNKRARDDYDGKPDDPPGGFEDKQDANDADDHVGSGGRTRALYEFSIVDDDIHRRNRAEHRERKVERMQLILGPLLARWVQEKYQGHAEREVDRALDHRVKHTENRRIELEARECYRYCRYNLGYQAGIAPVIRFLVVLF